MSDPRFASFFNWLLKWEGTVFEHDPDDPGGATKFGIDQRSHPKENIRTLTRERAAEIYMSEYWRKCYAHELPLGVGEVVANIAVNCGHSRAATWLQSTVGAKVDGVIGPLTVKRVATVDPRVVVKELIARTERHYRSIANGKMSKFLKGWLNRNADCARMASALIKA